MSKELNKASVEQAGGDERDLQAEGAQEVPSPVSQEYDRHLISLLRKGEALPGHQEEAADEIERLRDWNDHLNNTVLPNILNPNFLMLMKGGERLLDLCTKDGKFIGVSLNDMKDVFDWMVTHARIAPDHAALAQPSPAQAEQHWPKLEKPVQVGAIRFHAGLSSRLVVEAAQRLYEFESTPEKEAERIERLQAFREQLDPLNLAPHAGAFNEAPAEALKPEPAEAERPEVVGYRTVGRHAKHQHPHYALNYYKQNAEDQAAHWRERGCEVSEDELMTVAQHERIVGALRAEIAEWQEAAGRSRSDVVAYIAERAKLLEERAAALVEVERLRESKGDPVGSLEKCMKVMYERDEHAKQLEAALARVAELEKQEPVATVAKVPGEDWNSLDFHRELQDMHPGTKLYAAPVAQAQPEETPGEILAAKLIETWVTKHGKPAPWSTAVEITALATNMPNDERDRLLALDDDVDAQAQHSVPGNAAALVRAEGKKYSLNAAGMLDSGAPEHAQTFAIVQLLSEFDDEEAESHWEAIMAYSDFRTSDALFHAAELLAAAPGKEGNDD
ncbi:TPA: hypothetical protein ACQT1A_003463 [Pseudomonas aeruginosa]|uniref:hypothetical protein n=1 Tax=Pseudomonas aeruginosa TaxID=287 RepID=UPI0006909E6C|nr:hypothetical protein [Pseudomonas aeruginosa]